MKTLNTGAVQTDIKMALVKGFLTQYVVFPGRS